MYQLHEQNHSQGEEYTSPTNLKATPRPPAGLIDGRHLDDLAAAQRAVKEKEDALKQIEEAECDSASEKNAKVGAARHALSKALDEELAAARKVWPNGRVYRMPDLTRMAILPQPSGSICVDH